MAAPPAMTLPFLWASSRKPFTFSYCILFCSGPNLVPCFEPSSTTALFASVTSSSQTVVDGLVDIEALDREADLAAVLERPFEHAGRDLLRIDVVEDDAGIVAAEFERDALQRLGRARHHLLA